MHATQFQRVLDQTHARGAALLVLMVLAHHADERSRDAWPGLARLTNETHLSRQGVLNGIHRLVELGEVTIERGNARRANRYHVVVGSSAALRVVNAVDLPTRQMSREPVVESTSESTSSTEGPADPAGGSQRGRPEPSLQPKKEPSVEPTQPKCGFCEKPYEGAYKIGRAHV